MRKAFTRKTTDQVIKSALLGLREECLKFGVVSSRIIDGDEDGTMIIFDDDLQRPFGRLVLTPIKGGTDIRLDVHEYYLNKSSN